MEQRIQRFIFGFVSVCIVAVIVFAVARGTTNAAPSIAPRVGTATMTPESNRRYIEFTFGGFNTSTSTVRGNSLEGIASVRTGGGYALAVRADGSVFGWQSAFAMGMPPGGLTIPAEFSAPGRNVVEVLPTYVGAFARLSDGTVSAWGCSFESHNCSPPVGLVSVARLVASQEDTMNALSSIAIGAIKTDGSLVLWGINAPNPDASDLQNVRDALPFSNPSSAGLTVVHTDGSVATNATAFSICNEGSYQTCPLQTVGGLTNIQAVVKGGNNYEQIFIKSDGSLVCLCNGVVKPMAASFGAVAEMSVHQQGYMAERFIGLRNDGSVFIADTSGVTAAEVIPYNLSCLFNGTEHIGAISGAEFTIGRNDLTCPTETATATPDDTSTPTVVNTLTASRTSVARFTMTPVASATRIQTATATVVRSATKTATRTATAKPGKPKTKSPTRTLTKSRTPTKIVTNTRTPTKKGKPTATPRR